MRSSWFFSCLAPAQSPGPSRRGWLALFSLSLLPACDKAPSNDGGGTDSSSGSESSSTESGETGNDGCDGYVDETAEPLQIAITNSRPEPVYVLGANDCTVNHIHVTGDAGHWPPGDCEPTCAQLIAGNCACPESCAPPMLLRIEAGGSYMVEWSFVLAPDSVTEACVDPVVCSVGACPQAIVPPDGAYTISVDVLYAPVECEGVDDPCACPPGESSCLTTVLYGDAADLEIDFPTELPSGSLEVVIE